MGFFTKRGQDAANQGKSAPDTKGMSNEQAQKAQKAFQDQKAKNDKR